MATLTYAEIIQEIKKVCRTIRLQFVKKGDGRLTSAVRESEYLELLKNGLKHSQPTILFELQPVERWWWDFRVNGIPFNLKITTGGTDNAFNKVALLYSLTGTEVLKRNMNFNQLYTLLKETPKKSIRNPSTEYHYLVVNKTTTAVLVKPILDIHTFKSNPCNILQINWTNEFVNQDFTTPDTKFKEKIQELLKVIQTSLQQNIRSMNKFAEANLATDFP